MVLRIQRSVSNLGANLRPKSARQGAGLGLFCVSFISSIVQTCTVGLVPCALFTMTAEPVSGLEVVPQPEQVDSHKYPYYSPEPIPAQPQGWTDTNKIAYESAVYEDAKPATICGLRKRTFWIVVVVAIVIIAAAVGGGVGGALGSNKSSNKASSDNTATNTVTLQSQSDVQSSSTTSPTPTSSSPPITTTTIVGPTATILRDCPSSNNSVYSVSTGSTSQQFRKVCNLSFVNINGIASVVNGVVKTLDDCINACALYNANNRTQIAAGTNPICNSVCWRNTFDKTNDWEGGRCFGFTTQNITSNGESTWRYRLPAEKICDSAALMNQDF